MNHKVVGTKGEALAALFLEEKGYTIIERNYRVRAGELDIIARSKEGVTLFVEVKTAQSQSAGTPEEWVTLKKQKQIYRIAHHYNSKNGSEDDPMRFDVISIKNVIGAEPQITHYMNAFIPNLNCSQ